MSSERRLGSPLDSEMRALLESERRGAISNGPERIASIEARLEKAAATMALAAGAAALSASTTTATTTAVKGTAAALPKLVSVGAKPFMAWSLAAKVAVISSVVATGSVAAVVGVHELRSSKIDDIPTEVRSVGAPPTRAAVYDRAAPAVSGGGVLPSTSSGVRDREAAEELSLPGEGPASDREEVLSPESASTALPAPQPASAESLEHATASSSESRTKAASVVAAPQKAAATARAASAPSIDQGARPSPSSTTANSLGGELPLLYAARAAIERRAYAAAAAHLNEHAMRFPQGKLAEERELLMIQALTGSGQNDAARKRAQEFESNFPRSIFLAAIKAAANPPRGDSQ